MDKTDDHSVLLLNQTCISTDDVFLLCFMTVSFCKFYRCCVLITYLYCVFCLVFL